MVPHKMLKINLDEFIVQDTHCLSARVLLDDIILQRFPGPEMSLKLKV